jgi:Domain of unknown function (DUF4296)
MSNFEPPEMLRTIILPKGVVRPMTGLLITCFLLVCSCSNEKKEPILTNSEFTSLLVEFYLAEGRLNATPIPKDSAMMLFLPYEKKILAKRKISDEKLKATYRYYLKNPIELGKIYDAVIDSLNLREQRAGKLNL